MESWLVGGPIPFKSTGTKFFPKGLDQKVGMRTPVIESSPTKQVSLACFSKNGQLLEVTSLEIDLL